MISLNGIVNGAGERSRGARRSIEKYLHKCEETAYDGTAKRELLSKNVAADVQILAGICADAAGNSVLSGHQGIPGLGTQHRVCRFQDQEGHPWQRLCRPEVV